MVHALIAVIVLAIVIFEYKGEVDEVTQLQADLVTRDSISEILTASSLAGGQRRFTRVDPIVDIRYE